MREEVEEFKVHMPSGEQKSIKKRGDSRSCCANDVSRPIVAVSCTELALCCDITVLENLEKRGMGVKMEIRRVGAFAGKRVVPGVTAEVQGAGNICSPRNEAAHMTAAEVLEELLLP